MSAPPNAEPTEQQVRETQVRLIAVRVERCRERIAAILDEEDCVIDVAVTIRQNSVVPVVSIVPRDS